ncbi:protein regulator of cytokinesis 1-like [Pollicipes pollicipes]|uniref:protein regulator of cytokinesis 1-like n=1 Tax=Pollicipes pollicipes TaxID=41117 RepID=UPI001885902C|nr:protein regulator of cytokinesis 1-like [Pollicipes pollicipes]
MGSPLPESLARQRTVALTRLDAYHKQLLELFREIGVPQTDWEGRLGNIWGHVVATMQETAMGSPLPESLARQRTVALTRLDAYHKQLLELFREIGVPQTDWEGRLGNIWGHVVATMQEQLQARRDEVVATMKLLREEEAALCTQLEMPPLSLTAEIPQEADFREVREHALERSAEGELESQAVWAADGEFPLSEANLASLEAWLQRLEAEEAANKTEAETLRVPEERRTSVLASCTGHKPSTLRVLRDEVARHEELKRQNVEKFVRALRTEIAELWERCYYSESQRAAFTAFTAKTFTETLLEQHEEELERVRRYYDTNRVLIKDVDEHQKLWKKMLELEERANDPARWECQHNTTFLVHGHDFAAYIEQQKLDHQERKEQERVERASKKANQLEHS